MEANKNIYELRRQLKDEEACPVCGSLHHPYAMEYIDTLDELTAACNSAKATLEQKQQSMNKLERQINKVDSEIGIHSQKQEVEKNQLADINEKINVLKKIVAIEKIGSVAFIESQINETKEKQEKLQLFESKIFLQKLLQEFQFEVQQLQENLKSFSKANEALLKLYKGSNINHDCDSFVDRYNSILTTLTTAEVQISGLNREGDVKKDLIFKLEEELNQPLQKIGYETIQDAQNTILNNIEFNKLVNEETTINSEKSRFESLVFSAQKRLEKEAETDNLNVTIKDCNTKLDELSSAIEEIQKNKNETDAKMLFNEDGRKKVDELENEIGGIQQENIKWELLNKYIGDATGKTFSTFAQGLTLKKLVALANIHLKKLNDRYILDIPQEEEDDDLTIMDTYLGNERRSVKTLSGGEKFLVSLSLALALSDLASKNVRIESLFIDEGFGSLDPETLDQAISSLEQMQAESNKMIGIISHVEALKERIETQIQLEKGSNGFSKLKVIQI